MDEKDIASKLVEAHPEITKKHIEELASKIEADIVKEVKEITNKLSWNLDEIYPSIDHISFVSDVNNIILTYQEFTKTWNSPSVKIDESNIKPFLDEYSIIRSCTDKVFAYLFFRQSKDILDTTIINETNKISNIVTDLCSNLLFIHEQFKNLGHTKLIELSKRDDLLMYSNYLIKAADELKYMLSEPEENIILSMNKVFSVDSYDQLKSTFTYKISDSLGDKIVGEEDLVSVLTEGTSKQREEAFYQLYEQYNKIQNQIVFGAAYSAVVMENVVNKQIRKYNTVMSSTNLDEQISDGVVDDLISIVTESYPLYHHFLSLKAKRLNKEKLDAWDISCNLSEVKIEMSFDEGWEFYLATIKGIDKDLYDFSVMMLDQRLIDIYPSERKRDGAYAYHAHGLMPRVFLNWTDTIGDVFTLAHELGHAYHFYKFMHLNSLSTDISMSIAETASIFNETVVFTSLLQNCKEDSDKIDLIFNKLDDIFATIFRQIMYTRFERTIHEMADSNNPVSFLELNKLWLDELKLLVGDNVNVPEIMGVGWSRIPHIFHTPFYCKTYAIGNLISFGLINEYKNDPSFMEKYHTVLASGSSKSTEQLVKDAFNIELNKEFFTTGLNSISVLINELEKLLAK